MNSSYTLFGQTCGPFKIGIAYQGLYGLLDYAPESRAGVHKRSTNPQCVCFGFLIKKLPFITEETTESLSQLMPNSWSSLIHSLPQNLKKWQKKVDAFEKRSLFDIKVVTLQLGIHTLVELIL